MWLCSLACFTALACNVKSDGKGTAEPDPQTRAISLGSECGEDKPVCSPACTGRNEQCLYTGSACECVAICPQDPALRFCEGDGPNSGCDDGEVCNANCECEPAQTCWPDAPVCAGAGPNSGCDEGFDCTATCTCEPRVDTLPRASRSSTVDLTADDDLAAMVNSDEGSVSFFDVGSDAETRLATVPSSRLAAASEPMSVVLHPDGERAFVANRAAGTIARIKNIRTSRPVLDAELVVGGEPIGLALEPTGEHLWATNWVSGTVLVLDTETLQVVHRLDVGGNPYAIAITASCTCSRPRTPPRPPARLSSRRCPRVSPPRI
jgi:YVTN family beta-propeller protein